jgi:hypothetical protein
VPGLFLPCAFLAGYALLFRRLGCGPVGSALLGVVPVWGKG